MSPKQKGERSGVGRSSSKAEQKKKKDARGGRTLLVGIQRNIQKNLDSLERTVRKPPIKDSKKKKSKDTRPRPCLGKRRMGKQFCSRGAVQGNGINSVLGTFQKKMNGPKRPH